MKRYYGFFVIIALVLGLFLIQPSLADEFNDGSQIIIGLKTTCKPDQLVRRYSLQINDSIGGQRLYLTTINESQNQADVIDQISAESDVQFVEPNYRLDLPENFQMSMSFPDESAPPLLKDVSPSAYFKQPAIYFDYTDEAYAITRGEGVDVAIIDNGLDFNHPLFGSEWLLPGYDYIDMDADPTDDSGSAYGHGTFVSGIVLLTAPDCRIMPIRAFNGDGVSSSFAVAQSIYYAIDKDVDVINMSFGLSRNSRTIRIACEAADNAGIIMVAASGNESSMAPMYPAAYNHVIAVSAIDPQDVIADFSNAGPYIDVCAPGVEIYSALAGRYEWGLWSGTSFAAPFVSGTCALVKSVDPRHSSTTMETHIRKTAKKDLLWGLVSPPDNWYGYGKLDINQAVVIQNEMLSSLCGDANGDRVVDQFDARYILQYVFNNGPAPVSLAMADVNCDGTVDEADAVYLNNFLHKGGPPPCCQ